MVKWQSATGMWHLNNSTSLYTNSHSGTHSWWYGQESTGTYNNNSSNSGELVSMPFEVPTGGELRFWSWEQVESAVQTAYDRRIVSISTDNGATWTQLYQSTDDASSWHEVSVQIGRAHV